MIDEAEIQAQIQNDARNIDRLAERAYSRDFTRLGLGALAVHAQARLSRSEPFRLTLINSCYDVCARSDARGAPQRNDFTLCSNLLLHIVFLVL